MPPKSKKHKNTHFTYPMKKNLLKNWNANESFEKNSLMSLTLSREYLHVTITYSLNNEKFYSVFVSTLVFFILFFVVVIVVLLCRRTHFETVICFIVLIQYLLPILLKWHKINFSYIIYENKLSNMSFKKHKKENFFERLRNIT